MGRKPIPTHLKVVGGEKRPSRINKAEPKAKTGKAKAPAWLSKRGKESFDQIGETLAGMGIASPDDLHTLALLASRLDEIETLTAAIDAAGGPTYETEAGLWKARPEVGMKNEAMRHAQSLLSEFGLSPSARSKVSAQRPATANPFDAIDDAI